MYIFLKSELKIGVAVIKVSNHLISFAFMSHSYAEEFINHGTS